jgi:hypothetical protein
VTITPVLDLDDRAGVDAYETPNRTAESVYLRNPCCPLCTNTGRRKDSDHVLPYDPDGPPGQTCVDNLASR